MFVNRSKLILPALLLLAICMRLPLLGGSFWLDEAAQALESTRPLSTQLDIIPDFQPPLLHILLHFASWISTSEWFLRTVGALIPGLITVGYTYAIGKRLFSQKTAIMASLLLATSSLHIFFSQELRPYALPAAFATASTYYFFKYAENKQTKQLVLLVVLHGLGLYSSYLYPFFIIGQAALATMLYTKKQLIKYCISIALSIVSFLPLLPLFFKQLAQGGVVRTEISGWDQVVSTPQLKAIPMVIGKFVFGILPLDVNPTIIIGTILVLSLSLVVFYKQVKTIGAHKKLQWLLVLFLTPIMTAWIVSFWVPVIQPKRVLYLLPYFYLLICAVPSTKKRWFSLENSLFAAFLLLNVVSSFSYYANPKLQRENWRGLHEQIAQDFSREKSLLVFGFPAEFAPIAWYEKQSPQKMHILTTGVLSTDSIVGLDERFKVVVEYEKVLVFDYLRDLTDPEKKIERTLSNFGFKEVGIIDYPHIGFVRIFSRPETVISLEKTHAYWY